MLNKALITALFLLIGVTAHAGENNVTPYGDYCRQCTTYGTCKSILPIKEALAAIEQYYSDKGCKIGRVRHKGRFIDAEIYQNNRLVDRILFDRKTSRIRSIL